jgi:hypothetical protein
LGVFYHYGNDEEADYWRDVAYLILKQFSDAVDWNSICPDSVKELAERLGFICNFHYLRQPLAAGVALNEQDVVEMERAKSDNCDLELVHLPSTIDEIDSGPLVNILLSYVRSVAGPLPQGVSLRWLWRPSDRYRSLLTHEALKVMDGFGLTFPPESRNDARMYADRFRFGAYTLLPHIDWGRLSISRLKSILRWADATSRE